jgi:hypothetical protein
MSRKSTSKAGIIIFPGRVGTTEMKNTRAFFIPTGTISETAVALFYTRANSSAAAGSDVAVIFSGSSNAGNDAYSFAAGGTKITNPVSSLWRRYWTAAAGNTVRAFLFGGVGSQGSGTHELNVVETWSFADLSTLGASAATLSSTRQALGAASSDSRVFVFGGKEASINRVATVEDYSISSGAKLTPSPPSLTSPRAYPGTASDNSTKALVIGGEGANSAYTAQMEMYVFSTPGTKGAAPVSLSAPRARAGTTGTPEHAFIFGGSSSTATLSQTRQFDKLSFASNGAVVETSPNFLSVAESSIHAAAAK